VYPRVKDVEPFPGFKLLLTFENNQKRFFDVTPYMNQGIFKELHDVNMFRSVRVSFDTVEWGNGADLCPELLFNNSVVAQNATPSIEL
jgi:Protein of unknown function (DUF2442)